MNSSVCDFTYALKEIIEPYLMKVLNSFPQNSLYITSYKHSRICILILPETSQSSMVQEVVKQLILFSVFFWIDVTN